MLLSLARAAGEVGLSLAPVGAIAIAKALILQTKRDLTTTVDPGKMIHGMIRMPKTVIGTNSGARTPLHRSKLVLTLPIGLGILPIKPTIPRLLPPLPNSLRNSGNNSQRHSGSLHNSGVFLRPPPPVLLISLLVTSLPLLSSLPLPLCTLFLVTLLSLPPGHNSWHDNSNFKLHLLLSPLQSLYRRGGIPRADQEGDMEVAQGATKGAIKVAFLAQVRIPKEVNPALPNRLFKFKAPLNNSPPREDAKFNKSLM